MSDPQDYATIGSIWYKATPKRKAAVLRRIAAFTKAKEGIVTLGVASGVHQEKNLHEIAFIIPAYKGNATITTFFDELKVRVPEIQFIEGDTKPAAPGLLEKIKTYPSAKL